MGPQREQIGPPIGPPVLLSGKVHGVRRWEVFVDPAGALRLGGHGDSPWRTAGETTWAECLKGRFRGGVKHKTPPPAPRCHCGLYALHPWMIGTENWAHWLPPGRQLAVAGIVECWGQVQLHAEGVRAQYARPIRLVVIGAPLDSDYGRFVRRLARAHAADVRAFRTLADLSRHCASSKLGLPRRLVETLLELDP